MAVIRQRIYRKTGPGTYNQIFLETGTEAVSRPSGQTLEEMLQSLETIINTMKESIKVFERDGLKGYFVGASAPSNTKLLWIDTNSNTGGLKYYNGSSWVQVPVAYS